MIKLINVTWWFLVLVTFSCNVEESPQLLTFIPDTETKIIGLNRLDYDLKDRIKIDTNIILSLVDTDANSKIDTSDSFFNVNVLSTKQSKSIRLKTKITFNIYNNFYAISFIDTSFKQCIITKIDKANCDITINSDFENFSVFDPKTQDSLKINALISPEKYTIIKNWAPYCQPCIADLVWVESVDKAHDFEIVYLVDKVFESDIEEHFGAISDKVSVYLVDYNHVSSVYGFNGFPNSIIFKKGKYVKHSFWSSLKQLLDTLK